MKVLPFVNSIKSIIPTSKITFILLMITVFSILAQTGKTRIVLMAGQSNMSGRGAIRIPKDTITYYNILSLNHDSNWVVAKHPIHWDKSDAKMGMGISFARELQNLLNTKDTIGLVPCAAGGTNIDQWLSNAWFGGTGNFRLYKNLIKRAKKASENGEIIGLIWHQGEANARGKSLYTGYAGKLDSLFKRIRTDLQMPELPIVAGEVGRFLEQKGSYPYWDSINIAIHSLEGILSNYKVASSEDLQHKGDQVHFSSKSQEIFGQRYAQLLFPLIQQTPALFKSPERGERLKYKVHFNNKKLTIESNQQNDLEISLFSASGKLLKTAHYTQSNCAISLDKVKGMVFIQIKDGKKEFIVQKVVF